MQRCRWRHERRARVVRQHSLCANHDAERNDASGKQRRAWADHCAFAHKRADERRAIAHDNVVVH
eukprot:82690-Chlamydomonas_euryale.AAC.1